MLQISSFVHLRPARLPRGLSCLLVAVLYHTPGVDINIREHLFNSLAQAESIYPNCALIIAGDFNRLDVTRLKRHFHLKQIVKASTPKDAILDLVLTNLHDHYDKPQTLPPFGLSDHSTLSVSHLVRKRGTASEKFILKRDLQPSRKAEMGRYICSLDWPLLLSFPETCDELPCVFEQVIHTGLDLLMPVRNVLMNTRDAPWMRQHLKDLIRKRQQAFHNNGADSVQYKFYRNRVNRERKLCRAKFYESRVAHIKKEDPKAWWREMKRSCGGKACSGDLINHMNVIEVENLSTQDLANSINKAFLESLGEYRLSCPITHLALEKDSPEFLKYRRNVYGKSYQISIPLNRLAQTGFLIGFYENMLTLLPFQYAEFLMHRLGGNAYLDHGNLLT